MEFKYPKAKTTVFVKNNFNETEKKLYDFITRAYPENVLEYREDGNTEWNEDILTLLAMLSRLLGGSRKAIADLEYAYDLPTLVNSEDNPQTDNLLLLLANELNFNYADAETPKEQIENLKDYKYFLEQYTSVEKLKGTLQAVKLITNAYLDYINPKLEKENKELTIKIIDASAGQTDVLLSLGDEDYERFIDENYQEVRASRVALKQDDILYKLLMSIKPAGFVYNIVLNIIRQTYQTYGNIFSYYKGGGNEDSTKHSAVMQSRIVLTIKRYDGATGVDVIHKEYSDTLGVTVNGALLRQVALEKNPAFFEDRYIDNQKHRFLGWKLEGQDDDQYDEDPTNEIKTNTTYVAVWYLVKKATVYHRYITYDDTLDGYPFKFSEQTAQLDFEISEYGQNEVSYYRGTNVPTPQNYTDWQFAGWYHYNDDTTTAEHQVILEEYNGEMYNHETINLSGFEHRTYTLVPFYESTDTTIPAPTLVNAGGTYNRPLNAVDFAINATNNYFNNVYFEYEIIQGGTTTSGKTTTPTLGGAVYSFVPIRYNLPANGQKPNSTFFKVRAVDANDENRKSSWAVPNAEYTLVQDSPYMTPAGGPLRYNRISYPYGAGGYLYSYEAMITNVVDWRNPEVRLTSPISHLLLSGQNLGTPRRATAQSLANVTPEEMKYRMIYGGNSEDLTIPVKSSAVGSPPTKVAPVVNTSSTFTFTDYLSGVGTPPYNYLYGAIYLRNEDNATDPYMSIAVKVTYKGQSWHTSSNITGNQTRTVYFTIPQSVAMSEPLTTIAVEILALTPTKNYSVKQLTLPVTRVITGGGSGGGGFIPLDYA